MTGPDPASLRGVERADVHLADRLVATLSRHADDTIEFRYLQTGRLDRRHAVSWSLLANDGPVVTRAGALPPFFAGLLPEGIRLGVVLRSTKTSFDDELTLLLAVGGDTVGNVRVVPAGQPLIEPPVLFDPERPDSFASVFARLSDSVSADPVALAGVQAKVSAAMWSVPARTPAGSAILKLTPPTGFPRLVENEHFFMRMAADCGLRTARTRLLRDTKGSSALLVSRFDRPGGRRIAQEDACQVSGRYPAAKYRMKTETLISTLGDACASGGGSRSAVILELLRLVAFCWLIGNGDLHGKNISIHAPEEFWQPTPAYDLLCTQPYTGWRDPMALDLYGRANRLHREDFLAAGSRLGLRAKPVASMLDELVLKAKPWADRCAEIGFDGPTTDRLATMLRDRAGSLRD